MLIDYINKAMGKAVYDKLEDGCFSGKIPQCPTVIAFGKTLSQCQKELKSALEGWLIVKIRHGDKLPIIDRIDLNKKIPDPSKSYSAMPKTVRAKIFTRRNQTFEKSGV